MRKRRTGRSAGAIALGYLHRLTDCIAGLVNALDDVIVGVRGDFQTRERFLLHFVSSTRGKSFFAVLFGCVQMF